MTEPHVKLPLSAEELLRDFPLPDPDFDAQARAIDARLGAVPAAGAPSDDELFQAPELRPEPGEPPHPAQLRAAPKGHLAELARRSLHKQEGGSAALAKELLVAAAQPRRHDAALVERVRAAGKPAEAATPLPSSQPRPERPSGVVERTETPAAARAREPARDKRGLLVALGGVAIAAAAAFALFGRGAPAPAPAAAVVAAEQATASRPLAEPANAPPPSAAKKDESVLSPEALPAAPVAAAKAAPSSPVRKLSPTSPPSAVGATKPSARPSEVATREEAPAAVDPPPQPQQLAEAPEPVLRPAEGNAGSVPLSPSSGAVSTALGSVRGGAQACLAGQTEAVSATVTFASDGHVLRVSAGGPSGSCIQAALSKARIAPFAKDSFSATTTIRPP